MKKTILGAIVGGIIIFFVQFLSWSALQLHQKEMQFTPKQDSILTFLQSQQLHSGQYLLPTVVAGTSMDGMQKSATANEGKPWAIIAYHQKQNTSLVKSLIREFLIDVIAVWLLCWIISKIPNASFITIVLASLFVGCIIFLNSPYTYHIFYLTPGLNAYLIDSGAQWGATGLWLGWWMRRKASAA